MIFLLACVLQIQPKECKKYLDQENIKVIFGAWLREIDTEVSPTKEMAALLEHLLKLLSHAIFSEAEVSLCRLDKVRREEKIY